MTQLLLVVALTALAVGAAGLVRRRSASADPLAAAAAGTAGSALPQHLDRADFDRPDTPWLVVAFTSATCSTCASVRSAAQPLESTAVAVVEVEYGAQPELHRRYSIDGVPTIAIVDAAGGVRRWIVGPVSATHLWAAVAEAREPGSVPPGCGNH
jgi:hypothetical protein